MAGSASTVRPVLVETANQSCYLCSKTWPVSGGTASVLPALSATQTKQMNIQWKGKHLSSYRQKIGQPRQNAHPHFVQVRKKAIKYRRQVLRSDLRPQNGGHLEQTTCHRETDFILHVGGEQLDRVLEKMPIAAAEGEQHTGHCKGTLIGQFFVYAVVHEFGICHREEMVQKDLRHDILKGLLRFRGNNFNFICKAFRKWLLRKFIKVRKEFTFILESLADGVIKTEGGVQRQVFL